MYGQPPVAALLARISAMLPVRATMFIAAQATMFIEAKPTMIRPNDATRTGIITIKKDCLYMLPELYSVLYRKFYIFVSAEIIYCASEKL